MNRESWCRIAAIALLLVSSPLQLADAAEQLTPSPSPTAEPKPKIIPPIRSRTVCPTELEPLTNRLLRDLPSYLNRVLHQQDRKPIRYAIATSRPDLIPLPVVSSNLDPQKGGVHQVFFTLLEREYGFTQKTEFQYYYWLFLTRTETSGWNVAILYSRFGQYPANQQFPSPLQDVTLSPTAHAIRLWLRDCKVGAVEPL